MPSSSLVKIKYLVSYICDIFWSLLLCLAQIICDLEGRIISVHLGMGHNNDQGMFNLTGVREWLERNGLHLLSDCGYHHHRLIRPDAHEDNTEWSNRQKGLRSVVEAVAGLAKGWRFAAETSRLPIEWQEMALLTIYHFVAGRLKEFSLRSF